MTRPNHRKGRAIFADALTDFAARSGDRRSALAPVVAGLTAQLSVEVLGRRGVGRRTVAAALRTAGVSVVDGRAADLAVLVISETLKPEDTAMLAAARVPVLIVLNKADLAGAAGGGPVARAQLRAAEFRARTGVPAVPLIGLLACTALDAELVAALDVLVHHPADLRSTDAFLDSGHDLDRAVRQRMSAALDRFGIAHAVLALGRGADPQALPGMLRRLSGIDDVLAAIDRLAAPVRYRRVRSAVAQLQALAVRSGDDALSDFLAADDTVLAVMAAAVDVVAAAGLDVDPADDEAAHLRRAVRWRRYGRGPVSALHRECAADICHGSMRLLDIGRHAR
ncbi:hypothetical protein [Mycobacterium sp. NPDC050041]|uniref:hypothetical protein n=1 Tax=Mycobacterium sp. NPDC050041 TaxID=3364293 RepID=UPI003C3063BB